MLRRLSLVFLCVASVAPIGATEVAEPPDATWPSAEVENLAAFARLYGYVRFFHPSDEAAAIDWDRFAILGVIRVREVPLAGDLLTVMERLFEPIAPAVQIFPTGGTPEPVPEPEKASELTPIAWQHLGVRLPGSPTGFLSKRTYREARFSRDVVFGPISQVVDATPYRGKTVRLVAALRASVEGPGNQAQMWLRIDREGGDVGFFDNMDDRPVTDDRWRECEIVGEVPVDAERLLFGFFLLGRGVLMADYVRLSVSDGDGDRVPVEIANPLFEDGALGAAPPGWFGNAPGYLFATTDRSPFEGNRSLSISVEPDEVVTEDLFDAHPGVGEVVDVELGAGLSARIPLVVLADEGSTYPAADRDALTAMRHELDSVNMPVLSEFSECTRTAGIVIAWNVLQHFYPLFGTAGVDWASELPRALSKAVADESGEGYFGELESIVVSLNDGRARAYHGRYVPYGYLPIAVDWAENQLVVTASRVDALHPGDVITSMDRTEACDALGRWEARTSGSPQSKRARSLGLFGAGEVGEVAALSVRRGDVSFEVEVPRGRWNERPSEARPEPVDELEVGVFYVDLTRAPTPEVERRMPEITAARGVVFDLRGSLRTDHDIVGHLLGEPDLSTSWAQVSEIIRPDLADPIGWRDWGWTTLPVEPRINGNAAFLVDGRTIADAEAVADLVAVHDLAEIVGQPTAGAAGDVNLVTLPGGFELRWTGVHTVGRDGGTLNLTGVQPTVEVERTIQGIRDGRDELLEQAVRIVAAPRPEDPASP